MGTGVSGGVEEVAPLVRRLLAPNPSPFTYTGTWTHIVGAAAEVAIIDPGPAISAHHDAILAAVGSARIAAILVTHNHVDHSPGARLLQRATDAPILGCAPLAPGDDSPDAAYDADHRPDRILADGEQVSGPDWTLTAIATPGHTSNHLCFAFAEGRALFSGDHVMGWSTSIISPPDGDMAAYLASLEKLLGRDDETYFPAHGDPIADPRRHVRGLILHRRHREAQVLGQLERGAASVPDMVAAMYRDVDPRLHLAAERSVLAHLIDLCARGLVAEDGNKWRLA